MLVTKRDMILRDWKIIQFEHATDWYFLLLVSANSLGTKCCWNMKNPPHGDSF